MADTKKEYTSLYRAINRALSQMKNYGYLTAVVQGIKHPFDLVGIKDNEIFLVKVKVIENGKQPLPELLCKTLTQLITPPGVRREVWAWEKHSGFHYLTISVTDAKSGNPGGAT